MKLILKTGLLLAAITLPAHSAQMADRFADRPQISSPIEVLSADTTHATSETGELPYLYQYQRENTVWAEWTAPSNGWVVIDTLGTKYTRPMIAVFTGSEITALSTVARGYDPGAPNPARVGFPVAAGTAYQIMLDSTLDNSSGAGIGTVNIKLTAAEIPPSTVGADVFAERPDLTGSHAFGVANNQLAGFDPDEPETRYRRKQTIWWQWTAPATGRVTLDTLDSEIQTTLTVFAGSTATEPPFADLDPVADNNDVPNSTRSRLSFQTEAGRTYQIVADGDIANYKGEGNIVLRLDLTPNTAPAAIPGADDFGRRRQLSGNNAAGAMCNLNCTTEPFEKSSGGTREQTAWWQWTAPASGMVTVDTFGSGQLNPAGTPMDTVLKVWKGSELETLQEIVFSNDTSDSTWSKASFFAEKGTFYQIEIDGNIANSSGVGNIILNLRRELAPEITIQQPAGSNLLDGVTKKSFGTVRIGAKSVAKTFTIRNTGSANLTGLAVSRTGAHGRDFIVGPLAKPSLPPGASTTFTVTFAPRDKGTRVAALLIRSNDSDENPFDVKLTGMGVTR
ncbi:MAG: choice-of-anchor D domain-containing protein [Verrucomicrobiota bacterium]